MASSRKPAPAGAAESFFRSLPPLPGRRCETMRDRRLRASRLPPATLFSRLWRDAGSIRQTLKLRPLARERWGYEHPHASVEPRSGDTRSFPHVLFIGGDPMLFQESPHLVLVCGPAMMRLLPLDV